MAMRASLISAVMVAAAAAARCDPASDAQCATAQVFANTECSGEAAWTANVAVNEPYDTVRPAEWASVMYEPADSEAGSEVGLRSAGLHAAAEFCESPLGPDGSCERSIVVPLHQPRSCVQVDEARSVRIDYDYRDAGICDHMESNCGIIGFDLTCSGSSVHARLGLALVPDGACRPHGPLHYASVSCQGDSYTVKAMCEDEGCTTCAFEETIAPRQCNPVQFMGAAGFMVPTGSCGSFSPPDVGASHTRPEPVASNATCDPAKGSCATAHVFDNTNCTGKAVWTSSLPANPAYTTSQPAELLVVAYDAAEEDSELSAAGLYAAARFCEPGSGFAADGNCEQGLVVPSHKLRDCAVLNGTRSVLIDFDHRQAGLCERGEDNCGVIEIGDKCDPDDGIVEAAVALALVPDGVCRPSGLSQYTLVACSGDDYVVKFLCDDEACETCEMEATLTPGQCNAVDDDDTASFSVPANACGTAAPLINATSSEESIEERTAAPTAASDPGVAAAPSPPEGPTEAVPAETGLGGATLAGLAVGGAFVVGAGLFAASRALKAHRDSAAPSMVHTDSVVAREIHSVAAYNPRRADQV